MFTEVMAVFITLVVAIFLAVQPYEQSSLRVHETKHNPANSDFCFPVIDDEEISNINNNFSSFDKQHLDIIHINITKTDDTQAVDIIEVFELYKYHIVSKRGLGLMYYPSNVDILSMANLDLFAADLKIHLKDNVTRSCNLSKELYKSKIIEKLHDIVSNTSLPNVCYYHFPGHCSQRSSYIIPTPTWDPFLTNCTLKNGTAIHIPNSDAVYTLYYLAIICIICFPLLGLLLPSSVKGRLYRVYHRGETPCGLRRFQLFVLSTGRDFFKSESCVDLFGEKRCRCIRRYIPEVMIIITILVVTAASTAGLHQTLSYMDGQENQLNVECMPWNMYYFLSEASKVTAIFFSIGCSFLACIFIYLASYVVSKQTFYANKILVFDPRCLNTLCTRVLAMSEVYSSKDQWQQKGRWKIFALSVTDFVRLFFSKTHWKRLITAAFEPLEDTMMVFEPRDIIIPLYSNSSVFMVPLGFFVIGIITLMINAIFSAVQTFIPMFRIFLSGSFFALHVHEMSENEKPSVCMFHRSACLKSQNSANRCDCFNLFLIRFLLGIISLVVMSSFFIILKLVLFDGIVFLVEVIFYSTVIAISYYPEYFLSKILLYLSLFGYLLLFYTQFIHEYHLLLETIFNCLKELQMEEKNIQVQVFDDICRKVWPRTPRLIFLVIEITFLILTFRIILITLDHSLAFDEVNDGLGDILKAAIFVFFGGLLNKVLKYEEKFLKEKWTRKIKHYFSCIKEAQAQCAE